ncbi:5'-AMP-activated protein kinase subunit beta-1 isoform X1 [Metopolophium dirhodum]|uniref:5'-AMP-activated protein kinase subunit beta-1 isoform X1 n=1 Tax=Metopolophium dirhodum TaxID=44670 RepID=UPI00298F4883|nr:5'-AMP-activated protein kinase subunit beta-1 isoform X1 [Metopolophium dirhodum]
MGNTSGNQRHKSAGLIVPSSPTKEVQSQAFVFDKTSDSNALHETNALFPQSSSKPNDDDFNDGNPNSLSESDTENKMLPTVFRWDGGGKQVFISGTFSEWKPIPMVQSHNDFVTIIDLPEGEHHYKFCVDGNWQCDNKVSMIEGDPGITNNKVVVRKTDFEVFQALDVDSIDENCIEKSGFSQDIPSSVPWQKVSGPPILPPHLLQVILNKDTSVSCEPTLLPEPNHVMLNHLYALSIKDGVMVLSATHRYRKKYVTTLLYKPI